MIESTNSRVKPAATLAKAYVAVDKYNKKSGHVCSVNFLEQTADIQYGKEKDLDVPLSRLVIVATKFVPKLKPCTYTYYEVRAGMCKNANTVGTHGTIDCKCGRQ